MQIITVKKKSYVLSSEDVKTLKDVSLLLNKIVEDEDLAEIIESEADANVENAQDVIAAILNFDEKEIALCLC